MSEIDAAELARLDWKSKQYGTLDAKETRSLIDALEAAIAERDSARSEEREACAEIAEKDWCRPSIAAAIRARSTP